MTQKTRWGCLPNALIISFVVWGLLAFIIWGSYAFGHEWYPPDCCRNGDCAPISCDDVSIDRGRYKYRDRTARSVRPSPDDKCHGCIWKEGSGALMCLFIPNNWTPSVTS